GGSARLSRRCRAARRGCARGARGGGGGLERAARGHRGRARPPQRGAGRRAGRAGLLRRRGGGRGRGAYPPRGGAGARGGAARGWGCLATPATGRALPLGLVEPVARPVDPDALLATLRRHAARGARVLTVGADADALISLRQALVREGMSVAMAWDGARAVELLGTQRPEMVVIDLALAGRAGYALVARLAACDPPPVAALIASDDDAPAAFAAA